MGGPSKEQITLKELVLEQISIQKDEQGAIMNGCSKMEGYGEEDKGRTFFGKNMRYWVLMVASSAALVVGLSSASILGRYYYVHGGSRRWVYTWIESAGWPVLVFPLIVCYWRRGGTTLCSRISPSHAITPKLCLIYMGLGAFTAFDNLLYSLGCSYLPVSTNALLSSSQLVFNALFSYLLVEQKMSPCILNSIVIICIGTILLGIDAGSDKPLGTSDREYIIGFVVTIAASALYALLLPLLQLVYKSEATRAVPRAPNERTGSLPSKVCQMVGGTAKFPIDGDAAITNSSPNPSFLLVLEVQIAISAFASLFAFLGMCINADLPAMHAEALQFDTGVLAYVMSLVWSAIGWQLYFLGGSGIIFLSSSLMSCVFSTAMIPILPVLAVIFFHDSFSAVKGIAMILSMWGFISYIYDGYNAHTKSKKNGTQ